MIVDIDGYRGDQISISDKDMSNKPNKIRYPMISDIQRNPIQIYLDIPNNIITYPTHISLVLHRNKISGYLRISINILLG